jgi:hypothetical protein
MFLTKKALLIKIHSDPSDTKIVLLSEFWSGSLSQIISTSPFKKVTDSINRQIVPVGLKEHD